MTKANLIQRRIDELNAEVKTILMGDEWLKAIDLVARNNDLDLITESTQCRIYRDHEAGLVNCWIDAPDWNDNGFDDQVGWFLHND